MIRARVRTHLRLQATTALLVLGILSSALRPAPEERTESPGGPHFVGRESCKECHEEADGLWRGSDHDGAMQPATEVTVLGDFDDTVFERLGFTSRFYRRDGGFFVSTEGPDGEPTEYEIAYTFGLVPLQQYLIAFPGGRYQCLPLAWDTERKRWFHLYGDEAIAPDDWLHWTQLAQTWNGMCASCHSTDLIKGLDPETLEFDTDWYEIDVSCEACHGPCSEHNAWARIPEEERSLEGDLGLVVRTSQLDSRGIVELCARCHSRRMELDDYQHGRSDMLDSFVPEPLIEGHYYADGQILDEVYVWGSFVQSRMYAEGVHCGDCHDVHSGEPETDDNALCYQCHEVSYGTAEHHHHLFEGQPGDPLCDAGGEEIPVGSGSLCVSCHMPGRYYMVVDYRPDHSMRVPRPDLSMTLGTPNACNGCHQGETAEWAAAKVAEWYGPVRQPHYAEALAAGRSGTPGADTALAGLVADRRQPAIVRATALGLLDDYRTDVAWSAVRGALTDEESLVRHYAVRAYREPDLEARLEHVVPLLADPVRAVRAEAASNLAEIPAEYFPAERAEALGRALAEFERAMLYNADMPSGGLGLGNLYYGQGRPEKAAEAFESSLRVDSRFLPARANLAVIYSMLGRNEEAEACLREGLRLTPEAYDLAYSLSLLLVERGAWEEALVQMSAAAAGLPGAPRVHYNFGLLLQQRGRLEEAEAALLRARTLEPESLDTLYALTDHYLRRDLAAAAQVYAGEMVRLRPDDPTARELLRRAEAAAAR